jgi:HEAT repeat protein
VFRHINSGLLPATLFAVLSVSPCVSQDCEELKLASATDAVNALDRGEVRTAFCSRAAFQLIGNLPPEQAVPILIKYLSFGRPNSNQVHGLESRYPAVEALAKVGLAAEPALIDFIAHQEDDNSLQRANALEALALIRHFDVVPIIKLMRERSASLAGTPAASRLDSAAHYMLKTYCAGTRLQKCEKALEESDGVK